MFLDLLESKWIDSVSIDVEKANQIVRLLDAAVIKLEGGTDFDLKSLDESAEEEKSTEPDLSIFTVEVEKPVKTEEKNSKEAGEESDAEDTTNKDSEPNEPSKEDDESEKKPEVKELTPEKPETMNQDSVGSLEDGEASMDANSESKATLDDKQESGSQQIKTEENASPEKTVVSANNSDSEKPRPLHKTVSIFIRNIAPAITKQEIEEVILMIIYHLMIIFNKIKCRQLCRQYPGFLRLHIADPTSERRFYRRGWATYNASVNIREICWSLNANKVSEPIFVPYLTIFSTV